MMTVDELLADLEVRRLTLKPGDIVVARIARRITVADAAHVKELLGPIVAPHPVIVIDPSTTLEILEPGE